ncbi:Uncharacterised protein [Paenibacillus macerans]|uniref:Uncharacterized protein n=1 Tax=Paenibacillus macerans TaxID=44252 RepID=A0A090ZSJ4_PAEMA|nr:hypothetical protein DJ90_4551 [Paenibacillus macerans]SUA85864.1 Uncharacterised protein [Paenibacillus macerans]
MRERGLKAYAPYTYVEPASVAPYAGAWIESLTAKSERKYSKQSLPMRERRLKAEHVARHPYAASRSLCGSVD